VRKFTKPVIEVTKHRRVVRCITGERPAPTRRLYTIAEEHLMQTHLRYFIVCAAIGAVIVGVACSPKRVPPMTVADLMEDRVTLDGVLMKCNEDPIKARSNADCLNARVAIERLANQADPAEEAKRNAEFERNRERLRLEQDRARQEQEAKSKVDPYNLPVVPVDAAPTAAAPGATATAGLAQVKP